MRDSDDAFANILSLNVTDQDLLKQKIKFGKTFGFLRDNEDPD